MKITFEGTIDEIVQEMVSFLSPSAEEPEVAPGITEEDAARAEADTHAQDEEKPAKKSSSRRKTGNKAAARKKANGKAKESRDSLSDEDVAKAASEAATVLSAGAVKKALKEYGTTNVGELNQEQRLEFVAALDSMVENVKAA